ncbi:Coenzyme F420 hydrogenase/dehydrogenase, beta subunit C-terminal domain [Klebsiella oxytoca]|uniref:Coenzyme F420 hydrogenase/dehydrogenase, beta subunit C-terminal domain n=1 Tax=Klebsiella oxytoca TaxID=571 RepID=UPI000F5081D5|nr:Coenzyme F420 hydrogenase/dehydrogenase, beta subunit C-terminal domain [Klebsiella oxytoca]AYZ51166.1 coenzyme F420 hydrogenase [Klebsiella oxytoca]EJV1069308.1 Coenzyme F420 hydrogenase/dehydrogenase, beta subunit C-terminal domain [Klebsiella oxytoca]HAT1628518.1 coenzyme F420 hydrogenase [Klebsiella oxytoca]HBM2887916.1 Coenzyme F420 hydrogenase/dehydrogenase, beta subunit C-terminal domain [Klebsiella oxytoca]HEJ8253999.1 Coenzyme F420 hydrogenase/dehydrogenase, beta subunit C-terminal
MTLKKIVENNLCTGCGVCVSEDKNKATKMIWNDQGFYIPDINEDTDASNMERVCPFSLQKDNHLDEDQLAKEFLINPAYSDPQIGLYTALYAGYSREHRETSSSGGLATYIFEQLLRQKYVDYLFIVREFEGRYAYQLFSDADKIKEMSKTRYYPVTLASLFDCLDNLHGKVAVSGVACFIKAIRLKQHFTPGLKEKIPFLIGIICGGLKSKYYTDFLAQSSGCMDSYKDVEYRVKNSKSVALDYKFSCYGERDDRIHVVDMQSLGDMWGTGLFKSNACDFCDDVTTELADVSLGDAWIPPYNKDGLGNSVVIARSALAESIIRKGIESGDLKLDVLELSRLKSSQQGSFNHRHKGLLYRINRAQKKGIPVPRKRKRFLRRQHLLLNIIQYLRMKVRAQSLEIWTKVRNVDDFNAKMKPHLLILKRATRLNHKLGSIKNILK